MVRAHLPFLYIRSFKLRQNTLHFQLFNYQLFNYNVLSYCHLSTFTVRPLYHTASFRSYACASIFNIIITSKARANIRSERVLLSKIRSTSCFCLACP